MSVTIGDYTITFVEGDPNMDYWIQHSDGEGMGVKEDKVKEMFEHLWKDF